MTRIEDLQKQVEDKIKELEAQGLEEQKNKEIKKIVNESEKDMELSEIINEAEELSKEIKENTKEEPPIEEKKEENIKHNPLYIVSLMTAILLPPIGIILSIISIVKDKKNESKDNLPKFSLILSIVMLIALSAIGTIFYLEYKDNNKKVIDIEEETTTTTITTTSTAIKSDAGTKFYFISHEDEYGKNYNITTNIDNEERYTLESTYTCNQTPCSYYVLSNNGHIVLLDNNEYFLYNYLTGTKMRTLNLDGNTYYNSIKIYEDDNQIYGYSLYSQSKKWKGDDFFYYDDREGKITFTILPFSDYDCAYMYDYIPNITNKVIVGTSKSEKVIVYNYKTKSKLFELGGNHQIGQAININDKVYYVLKPGYAKYTHTFTKLFDENFNLVVNNLMLDVAGIGDNRIVVTSGNYIYYYENNIEQSISNYYDNIYYLFSDYFVAEVNNEVYLYDYKENVEIKLFAFTKDTTVRNDEFGRSRINGNDALKIVVGDASVTCDDISFETLIDHFGKDKTYAELQTSCRNIKTKGYEYYYIPSTGELVKKPTLFTD